MNKVGKKTLEVMSNAERYNKWIMSWLRPHVGTKILETGAGIGNFSKLLSSFGKLTLIDFNKGYVDILKKKKYRAGIGDIEKGKYFFKRHEKFDTIINLNVIEHIKDDTKTIANFYNLLEPGGKALIITPAHQFAYSQLDKNLGHYRRYTKKSLERKFKEAGFNIVDSRYLNFLGLLGWIFFGKFKKEKSLKEKQLSLFDVISPPLLLLEKVINVPLGLSVFVVAEKPREVRKAKKLSVIIPVFNEEKTIENLIKKVKLVKLNNLSKEIIVVNDGSTDQTENILEKIRGVVLINKKNEGKGSAVREGIKKSTGDIVLIQDADLEYDPKDYTKLLKPILANKTNVVYGSRLRKLKFKLFGESKTLHPQNYVANKFLSAFVNLLFRTELTDMETCYKVFNRNLINPHALTSKKFEIEPELTALFAKQNEKILEVDIKVIPRAYSEGKKIKPSDGFLAIRQILLEKFII